MKCNCLSLDNAFYLEKAPAGFLEGLTQKETGNWKYLCLCPICGTYWAIDEWDKYFDQVVTRVTNIENWDVASEADRKNLLLESRGGLTNEICAWVECTKMRVKGVAYCIDHLYATGARK